MWVTFFGICDNIYYMEEKELKTSGKQRVFISLIAIVMLGSILASYVAIVMNGSSSKNDSSELKVDEAKIAEYTEEYEKAVANFSEATKDDFNRFSKYRSEVKAYNESTANEEGIKTKDYEVGSGAEITGKDSQYLAYYIGWCADETVFDSSFDDSENPTALAKIVDPSVGMIEGWNKGVVGMKIGGIREMTIPGELAYGETQEICGGLNKPLKFIAMAVEKTDEMTKLADAIQTAGRMLQNAYYGVNE